MAKITAGVIGEVLAARYLRGKGYELMSANVRSRFGEIDIIATDGTYIAFIEVKTRSEDSFYLPREAVTYQKQRRIIKTAAQYIKNYGIKLQPRFDVIEIVTQKGKPSEMLSVEHLMSAFETGDLREAF